MGGKRGHKHERFIEKIVDALLIGGDPADAAFGETGRAIGEQLYRLEQIEDHHRLEGVQLKMPM